MLAAKPQKRKKLRHSEYYNLQDAFDDLYANSKEGKIFTNLLPLISSDENIMLAYRNIKRNKGSGTGGMDELTIEDIQTLDAQSYVQKIQKMLSWYEPRKIRRKEIPKPNGKKRPLGIPSIWDRLFQQCILQVLEPICEAKFHERSNGFRPNRSAEHAIAQCYQMIQWRNLHFVVDVDIEGFFDNVNHTKLIQQMWTMGIRDKNLLCIIRKMLKAPIVLPDGTMEYPQKGTPQGGILSPLLSNIVLNELDWWVTNNWEEMPTHTQYTPQFSKNGGKHRGNTFRTLRKSNLKEMYIVRYADDFKIFCRKKSDADKTFIAIQQWLSDRLKLTVSKEKSSVTNLKKRYTEFLGIKMKVVKKKKRYVIRSHVCGKALQQIKETLKNQACRIARPQHGRSVHYEVNRYNAMVMGHHNYFKMATCVNLDFNRIAHEIDTVLKNRLKKRLKRKGEIASIAIRDRYGGSKRTRYVNKAPVLPFSYIQCKPPLFKKLTVNAYTKEGRVEIHKNLGIDMNILRRLMQAKEFDRTIEYVDNRLSLYCAQHGKCAITGCMLELDEIHCHHRTPKSKGGTDKYSNLIIVHSNIHRLIHATNRAIVDEYMQSLTLDSKSKKKLNKLRKLVGNEPICA